MTVEARLNVGFEVVGLPLPQGRARARVVQPYGQRAYARFYDPPRSANWKQTIMLQALPYRPAKPSERAIFLRLTFRMPRPKSLAKRVSQHTKKPDLDNLVKAVQDALRGVFYRDDSQIAELQAVKRYSPTPGVTVAVSDFHDD